MNITLQSRTSLQPLLKKIEDEEIVITGNKNCSIINLKNPQEFDIFISLVSRFFFTRELKEIQDFEDFSVDIFNKLKKDFSPLIYIRLKLIAYFENENYELDIQNFERFNLSDLYDVFVNSAQRISILNIRDEVAEMFSKNFKKYRKIKLNFIYAISKEKFFINILYSNDVLFSITQENIRDFEQVLNELGVKEIILAGCYNKELYNELFSRIINNGIYNIKIEKRLLENIKEGGICQKENEEKSQKISS